MVAFQCAATMGVMTGTSNQACVQIGMGNDQCGDGCQFLAALTKQIPNGILIGTNTGPFPKNISEYEYIGGLKGQAVPVVKAQQSDLLIPANADLVIEGVIEPKATRAEGPFGEFTGYYGSPVGEAPLVKVTAIHYRDNPILTNALMADYPSCEQSGFFAIIRSAKIWDDLDKLGVPGIAGVYAHPPAALFLRS